MNGKQKILTGVAVGALGIWWMNFSDALAMKSSISYHGQDLESPYWVGLLVMVAAYAGIFFMVKTPPAGK